ncbi:Uncharacterized protein GBIM_18697 [Gryllus bimaculatus]|nr:Uncharacterized protein GBIM_18697 [Gryllus bimaculatus]
MEDATALSHPYPFAVTASTSAAADAWRPACHLAATRCNANHPQLPPEAGVYGRGRGVDAACRRRLAPFRPPGPPSPQRARHGYFEDGDGPPTPSARAETAHLLRVGFCTARRPHARLKRAVAPQVSGCNARAESIHLPDGGQGVYSADGAYAWASANQKKKATGLEERATWPGDRGGYECQGGARTRAACADSLKVIAPEVTVVDEGGHRVTERHYRTGSTVELTCVATQLHPADGAVEWRRDGAQIVRGVSNASAGAGGAVGSVTSTLRLPRASRAHSGNYTCAVGRVAAATVAVHVLNGAEQQSMSCAT